MEEKSYTMQQMAERKFELSFDQIFSFSQLYGLKKTKQRIRELWKDHKQLYDYLEKARIYSLLVGKEELYREWWQDNKYRIGFPVIDQLFKKLKYRLCAFCHSPFSDGNKNKIYCGNNCKAYAYNQREKNKTTAT